MDPCKRVSKRELQSLWPSTEDKPIPAADAQGRNTCASDGLGFYFRLDDKGGASFLTHLGSLATHNLRRSSANRGSGNVYYGRTSIMLIFRDSREELMNIC